MADKKAATPDILTSLAAGPAPRVVPRGLVPTKGQIQALENTRGRASQLDFARRVLQSLPQIDTGVRPLPSVSTLLGKSEQYGGRSFLTGGGSGGSGGGGGTAQSWSDMILNGTASKEIQDAWIEHERSKARALAGAPQKGLFDRLKGFVGEAPGQVLGAGARALDVIQRPLYGISNVEKAIVEKGFEDPGAITNALYKGISGKEKTTGADIIQASVRDGQKINPIIRAAGGMALDVLQDPLSWVSGGATSAITEGPEIIAKNLVAGGLDQVAAKQAAEHLFSMARQTEGGIATGAKPLLKSEVKSAAERIGAETERQFVKTGYVKLRQQLAATGLKGADLDKAVADTIKARTANVVNQVQNSADYLTKGRSQIKLGFLGRGSNVLPSAAGEKLYSALHMPTQLADKLGMGKTFQNLFNFEYHFPGLTQEIRNRLGVLLGGAHEELRREMLEMYKGTTKADRELITRSIEDGVDLTGRTAANGTDLGAIQKRVQEIYKHIFDNEVAAGKRNLDEWVDNYTYQTYGAKGEQGRKDINAFREKRKGVLREKATTTAKMNGITIDDAIAKGIKPDLDSLSNVLNRHAKYSRDLHTIAFRNETLLQYGAKYDHLLDNPGSRGLVRIPDTELTPQLKQMAGKGGWYLPEEQYRAFQALNKMNTINNADLASPLWRSFDTANRWFKQSRTIFRPGYQINNAMGDIFMAYLDGVTPADYVRFIAADQAKRSGSAITNVAGHAIDEGLVDKAFDTHGAASGFYHSDIGARLGMRDNPVANLPGATTDVVRKFSEHRENFFRKAHFRTKMFDELRGMVKKNGGKQFVGKELDDALEEAARRAARSVNRFHVDYTALTPFEQEWVKRFVPFYTYIRRAAPVMMHSAFTNPGRVSTLTKGQNAIATAAGYEPGENGLNMLRIPEYLRESNAFVQLTGGTEPWLLKTNTMLPMFNLLNPFGVQGEQGQGTQDWSQLVSKLNPMLTAPFQLAAGKNFFTGAPVTGPVDVVSQQFNPFDWLLRQKERGLPSGFLSNIGIERLPANTQEATIRKDTEKYKAANELLNKRNLSKGLEIRSTNRASGTVYQLIDRYGGQVLGEYLSPAEAQMIADKIQR